MKQNGSHRPIRTLFIPPSSDLLRQPGRIILKDGTAAELRISSPSDTEALRLFIDGLSPESKRHRFFSATVPHADLVQSLCDSSDPHTQITLIALRLSQGRATFIAAGTYTARDAATAEVSLAVDDRFHGKGIGTILVEHLALLAVRHGFTHLWAVTHADNVAMRDVFRESGFTWHEYVEGGDIEVELSLTPTEQTVSRVEWRDRVATVASIRPFFHPQAVAIIGASADPASIGYRLVDALSQSGFPGPVYPINLRAGSIAGLPAYPRITAVPGPVDLAVIAVPRDAVLGVVEQCAEKQVRGLIVITAGFAEVGDEGHRLEQRLVELVRRHGMRMIGPNCFGLLNADPAVRLNATFAPFFPPAGHIAMSSQSGALGIAVLSAARRLQLGVSTFVSVGNKADVSVNDLLQYWETDPATQVVMLYVESFGNPRRFARIARRVGRQKPIIAVKAGRSGAGHRAAGSHTAALAANNVAVEALFHQTGLLRADTLDDMLALAAGLSNQSCPKGRRVGILTNAGGPAILCTDACEAEGLTVPELSPRTYEQLASFLPPAAAVKNPVDLIASATPDQYAQAIMTLLAAEEIDALIILYISLTPTDTGGIADGILSGIRAARQAGVTEKPVYVTWMAEGDRDRSFMSGGETIPSYALPETPARVLSKAATYQEWKTRPAGRIPDFPDMDLSVAQKICASAARERGDGWLTADETKQVLTAIRLPLLAGGLAKSVGEAVHVAEQAGFPVAIKLASRTVVHKTDVGGVILDVADASGVRDAFKAIQTRLERAGILEEMEGVLVQPMLRGGVEVMIGVTQDLQFGPLVAFGLGGIYVEILGDVQFRIAPLTEQDAEDMVAGIKGYRLLKGYRGQPVADIAGLEDALLRVSRLAEEVPAPAELDCNPVFALPKGQGCRIVDARIRVTGAMSG
jgi:acetyl coenzyme A synthetase (ADP forming)-like protein